MSPRRINEIVLGKRAITGDTAIRLSKFFGVEPEFWMNLQSRFDLETAEDQFDPKVEIGVKLARCAQKKGAQNSAPL